ncbi:hypothetical protein RRG08_011416 [Elysia crispata]|uniref:Uncharacterized protein n=1 Tax=Elysia crispata TaxID=231223 RepID=A0AAE1DY00_9GAST|nr:hypothetical protein RRG08_011416 [Elysia crispata]
MTTSLSVYPPEAGQFELIAGSHRGPHISGLIPELGANSGLYRTYKAMMDANFLRARRETSLVKVGNFFLAGFLSRARRETSLVKVGNFFLAGFLSIARRETSLVKVGNFFRRVSFP